MKILHTGDWHIGKVVDQMHMLEDQEYMLNSLIKYMETDRPDVLVVSGDIYDRAIPPAEAVEMLDRVLNQIILELQIPVLMIAGNHDSPDRLGFGSQLLESRGLHIEGRFHKQIRKVVLADEYGPVNFYLVPYAPPAVVREVLGQSDIIDQDSAMKAIIEAICSCWDSQERNVLVTHGFVRGIGELELSESEKPLSLTLSVGGTDYVDVKLFEGFSYTALGHLHAPQRAGQEHVRYSGSLLKYSASETRQKKSVTLVELGKDGVTAIECKALQPLRDMRSIKGELANLLDPSIYKDTHVDDYLHVVLTDEGELIEPMSKLRAVYPNVLTLTFEKKTKRTSESKTAANEGYEHKSKLELFTDFYQDITGEPLSERREAIVANVIQGVENEEREA